MPPSFFEEGCTVKVIAALGAGGLAITSAVIVSLGGIIAATITAWVSMMKEARDFQRKIIERLLDREESILIPIISSSENMQESIKTIGGGVRDLLSALKVEEALRNTDRRDR